ncbi:hypothetical protein PRIPAC_96098 [Pristionchus pacificus]|uniref:Uncharacterized protein n=1 Tax=Pristionchus pacificus TaxID=54126 RepID=A0A2A6D2G4_PRIPA|nr:hypothetical protein PRIPAC_96098 [Pristionchus pacificus]|eukprot:PDM84580.1 hypothetical protein PRIPAC_33603 [Pristionchus pacificus]
MRYATLSGMSKRALATGIRSQDKFEDFQQDTKTNSIVQYTDLSERWKLPHTGTQITRNLSLAMDADRTHPMFWQFIESVRMLEEAMLGAMDETNDGERY